MLFKLSLQLKGGKYLYTGNLAAQAKLFLVSDPADQSECRIRVLFKVSWAGNTFYAGSLAAQAKLILLCVNVCNPLGLVHELSYD